MMMMMMTMMTQKQQQQTSQTAIEIVELEVVVAALGFIQNARVVAAVPFMLTTKMNINSRTKKKHSSSFVLLHSYFMCDDRLASSR